MFVDLREMVEGAECHVNGSDVKEPGIYAVVRSLKKQCDENVAGSKLVFKGKKQNVVKKDRRGKLKETDKAAFVLINVECIADTAVVIPNIGGDERDVLILTSRTKWASKFIQA